MGDARTPTDPASERAAPRRARSLFRRLAIFLAVATAALVYSGAASAATFVVNTVDDLVLGTCDATHCSLREAIIAANTNGVGHDLIAYNIALPPPNTITPVTPYPPITSEVTIDGTTEPNYAGTPIIEINGALAGASGGLPGFWLLGGNSTFRGHVVNRFTNTSAVQIQSRGGDRIEGNYIGTDVTGTVAQPNQLGIVIFGPSNNTIGGTTAQTRNVVSGNSSAGIELRSGTFEGPAANNLVIGNRIGTDVTGLLPVPNGVGMTVGGDRNTIGGPTAGERNIISGNRFTGMSIGGASNLVQGNYVGVDATGTTPLGNRLDGIDVGGPSHRLVGNVVSGNGQEGIQIAGAAAVGNVLEGNFIGTDATGTVAIGNGPGFRGVVVAFGPTGNRIGGTTAAARNIISANGIGIWIATANTTGNLVQGNYIGTDVSGTNPLPNREGVQISANANTLGGTSAGAGNVISGNQASGVNILAGATGNFVQGNLIGTQADGTSPLPNGFDGVVLNSANDNLIGGLAAGAGNTIAFNVGAGVEIFSGVRNGILGNSIHSNTRLGIDLAPFGPTPNDLLDADPGANQLQNFPLLTSSGGTLMSAPNTTYRIEFFSNSACDPSGFGEGERFLSAISVTTDALGMATFAAPAGTNVTATATDPLNNTSEFSNCERLVLGPPATLVLEPPADENPVGSEHCVTATVRDAAGVPTPGITVRFQVTGANTAAGAETTDANGQARFCYTGQNLGEDAIRAFADTDGDGIEDVGEPFGVAAKTWTPGAPATLVLEPKVATNAVGAQHCVTATVRDALGNPVPDATVRFEVTGAHTVSGQAETDADGRARFCYTGTQAGEDAIRAYADTNGDATEDPGEPFDTASKTWASVCPRGDDDRDDDGLDDARESLFGALLGDDDSDDDGVRDGNEDSDDDGEDDEDEDDDEDTCPDDDDGDGEDDEDEDDDD